jgi:hypothetical protein
METLLTHSFKMFLLRSMWSFIIRVWNGSLKLFRAKKKTEAF